MLGVSRSATARLPVPPDCPGWLARQVPVAMFPVAGMKADTNSERRIRKKKKFDVFHGKSVS